MYGISLKVLKSRAFGKKGLYVSTPMRFCTILLVQMSFSIGGEALGGMAASNDN